MSRRIKLKTLYRERDGVREEIPALAGRDGADGKKGDTGATGATGATPQLQVGAVQTLKPGSNAQVSIGGTPERPVLNMGIPAGEAGGGLMLDPSDPDGLIVAPGTIAEIDKSLTLNNYAADAKIVGDAIGELKDDLAELQNTVDEPVAAGKVWTTTADGAEWKTPTGGGISDVQLKGESIVTNGVANIPNATNSTPGVVTCQGTRGVTMLTGTNAGILALYQASQSSFNNRSSYHAVTSSNIDLAVKSAMCDGKGAAWTAEEQAAARDRIGIGEIEYIDTVTLEEDTSAFVYNLDKYYRYLDVYVSQNTVETKYNGNARITFSDSATAKSDFIIQAGQNMSATSPNLRVTAEHAVDVNILTVTTENSMNNVTSYPLYRKIYGIRGENPDTSKISAIRPFNRISTSITTWKAGTVFYIRGVRA